MNKKQLEKMKKEELIKIVLELEKEIERIIERIEENIYYEAKNEQP